MSQSSETRAAAPGESLGVRPGILPALQPAEMPAFPGWWKALGPGIVWMALAQGSGELIWWPYIVGKYGLGFLFLLVPACLLQVPLNYQIGRYTLLTGESILQGFVRLNRWFALGLWLLMMASLFWVGAWISAGSTATAALTGFPGPGLLGWRPPQAVGILLKRQTLFWSYGTLAILTVAILFSRIVYRTIERVMVAVTVITVVGFLAACLQPSVLPKIPAFLAGLAVPERPLPARWDPMDAERLLTAITFAGLGGFWTLFYSYWLREKGAGLSARFGRVTGPITGKPEVIPGSGFVPAGGPEGAARWRRWSRFLLVDNLVGVVGNLLTTFMTCLLAYALLHGREELLPKDWYLASVQARFFDFAGRLGPPVFCVLAACFLCDTWLATADALGRANADFLQAWIPAARRVPYRKLYFAVVVVLSLFGAATLPMNPPQGQILLAAILGFVGTVIYTAALIALNHVTLPRLVPGWARPGRVALAGILVSLAAYLYLAARFVGVKTGWWPLGV